MAGHAGPCNPAQVVVNEVTKKSRFRWPRFPKVGVQCAAPPYRHAYQRARAVTAPGGGPQLAPGSGCLG